MARQTEIEKLERRYEEKPSQWFAALAEEYRRAGDVDLALDIVRKGLEQRSTYVSGHVVLARCLLQQNNDGEAEQVLKQVLELDSENIIALKVLSEIKERANDTAAALEWLERLLEVDPMNQDAQESVERLRSPVPAEVGAGPPDEGLAPDEPQDVVATEKMTAVELEEAGLADTAPPEEGEQAVPAGVAGVETGSPGEVSVLETIPAVPSDAVGEAVAVPEVGGVGAPVEPPSADLAAPESAPAEPGPLPVQAVPEAAPTVPEPAAVAASEPEPVVTETIADVYFSQGLYAEARVVYQQLLEQRPDDASLQAKLADLEGRETSVERPESAPVQVFAARETGGLSARAFVTGVLAATVGTPSYQASPDHVSSGEASPAETAPTLPEEPSPLEAAFEAPEPAGLEVPGEPTQPAADSPSLAAVFDETPGVSGGPSSPSPPDAEQPDGEPAAKDGEMSFDEFFGDGESQEPAGETSEPTADQADDVREDQDFKDWLKGLKS